MSNHSVKEKWNYEIFLLWWYFESITKMIPDELTLLKYISYLFIFLWAVICNQFKFSKNFICFCFAYVGVAFLNASLVGYSNYALVESITPFCVFITPIYLFSLDCICLSELIKKWKKWYLINTVFIVILLLSPMKEFFSYGVFATFTVPNIVITLYCGIIEKDKVGFVCFLIQYSILFIFGSRMPAVAVIPVCFVLFLYPIRKHRTLKIFGVTISGILGIVIFQNLKNILLFINTQLAQYNISSRTLTMALSDWGNKTLFEMMESSGRKEIWELAVRAIKERYGIPGGFGVIRAMSNGERYYSHNFFLDIWIVMGVFSIFLLIVLFVTWNRKRNNWSENDCRFLIIMAVYFFVCSMTGAHFLSDKHAVLFWGMVLFSKGIQERKPVDSYA